MAEMTHAEPLLDDGDAATLQAYPGRYLASTVALTLQNLAATAQAQIVGLQGHGCEANAQRAHSDGQVKALRSVWRLLVLPGELLPEVRDDRSDDPGQQATSDDAVTEGRTEREAGQAEEHGGDDQQDEHESGHGLRVPRPELG